MTGKPPGTGTAAKESPPVGARAQILAAAAELAKEKGAAHISLEAIARRAGVSKGGLLYHFPRKDALIHALVEHYLTEVDAALAEVEAANRHRRTNAVARAFVALSEQKLCHHKDRFDGVLLALAENPHLLDPMRTHERRIVERIQGTAADRELSLIAVLVVQGIRALELFDANPLTDEECRAVLARLTAMLADPPEDGVRPA